MDSTSHTLMRCLTANPAGERCRKDQGHTGGHDLPTHIVKCSGCGCPLHSSTTTGFCSDTCAREAAHLAHARYLGADAALSSNTWIEMGEDDARSVLSDVDPEVMDRFPEPTLGEWEEACDETLAHMVAPGVCVMRTSSLGSQWVCGTCGTDCECYVCTRDDQDAIATAWEEGRDEVWSDALQATALRVLGDVVTALEVEARYEATVSRLRSAAGL